MINRSVSCALGGQRTLCRPTVANPTAAQRIEMMKHKAIFSLHACRTALSFRPPMELKRTDGAQNVTTRQKTTHTSKSGEDDVEGAEGDTCRESCGLMRGGGATPRSGRVRVFALRTVPEGADLGMVVRIGTSSWR